MSAGQHSDAASADSVSADLVGILDTVDLPIVAVGRDFTVARFNRSATAVLSHRAATDPALANGLPALAHGLRRPVAEFTFRERWNGPPLTAGAGRG